MITIDDVLICIGTCKKYHNTRLKILTNTLFNTFNRKSLLIFSDQQQNVNGYTTIKINKSRQHDNFNLFKYIYTNYQFKYVITLTDDSYFDIKLILKIINQFDINLPICAGFPLHHLQSNPLLPFGFLSGGNIRIYNKVYLQKIYKYLDVQFVRSLPGVKINTDEYKCQDVMLGIISTIQKIKPINIFTKQAYQSYIGVLQIRQMIYFIKMYPQVGYHFIDHMITNDQQMQNKYLKYMMNYLYKNNL